jgi:hypothetical protein
MQPICGCGKIAQVTYSQGDEHAMFLMKLSVLKEVRWIGIREPLDPILGEGG